MAAKEIDPDLFSEDILKFIARPYRALEEFWGGDVPAANNPAELEEPGVVPQFGRPPNRLDLINAMEGASCEEAFAKRELAATRIGSAIAPLAVTGREEFARKNRAVGRPKDMDDVRGIADE